MNNPEAKELLTILLSCQKKLDQALLLVEKINVETEREQLREAIMSIMADIYVETIRKVVIQHPELEPYKKNDLTIDG